MILQVKEQKLKRSYNRLKNSVKEVKNWLEANGWFKMRMVPDSLASTYIVNGISFENIFYSMIDSLDEIELLEKS